MWKHKVVERSTGKVHLFENWEQLKAFLDNNGTKLSGGVIVNECQNVFGSYELVEMDSKSV